MRTVSVQEMKELDRKAIEEIGISSIVLMENAGKTVAEAAIDMIGDASRKRVAIFCGTGNNGGDGFVAARHLARKGAVVSVYIVGERSRIKNAPKVNLERLGKIRVEIREIDSPVEFEAELIIDAIFGIGLKGEVKEPVKSIIAGLNKYAAPVISVDVPSGLDADTGEVQGEAIRATKTVTVQFPKKGFYLNKGPGCIGELIVADIGI